MEILFCFLKFYGIRISDQNFMINISIFFSRFLFIGFKYLIKRHLKHLVSSFWILINPFIGFLGSLANWKWELSPQGVISGTVSWCCNIQLIVQPDLSYVLFSTLDKCCLCWISSSSGRFVSLNSVLSESNHKPGSILFLTFLHF